MTTAQDPFALAYMGARDLQEAEKNRDPTKLKQFDFGVTPQVRCSLHFLTPTLTRFLQVFEMF